MKIALVSSPVTPLRPAQVGGAQAFICELGAALSQRGHVVTVYCAAGSEVEGVELATVPQPADAASALVMPAGRPPAEAPGVEAAFREMFESIRSGGFDVVSQHAFDAPAFELARGLPVVHTLHLPPILPALIDAARAAEPEALATVSRSCRAGWSGCGVDVRWLLPNGVADVAVPPVEVERAALVAGRISPEKGIDDAIRAARAAGLAVRIAGDRYDPAYEPDLRGAEWLGALPRDRLRALMAASAVTICAVRWEEPFGMVAAEAQMAGCPVAAYRRGAMPEVVEDGVSGILAAPGDVQDLRRAVERCLELDREAVRASARRRLGLDRAVDGYEDALRQVAR